MYVYVYVPDLFAQREVSKVMQEDVVVIRDHTDHILLGTEGQLDDGRVFLPSLPLSHGGVHTHSCHSVPHLKDPCNVTNMCHQVSMHCHQLPMHCVTNCQCTVLCQVSMQRVSPNVNVCHYNVCHQRHVSPVFVQCHQV